MHSSVDEEWSFIQTLRHLCDPVPEGVTRAVVHLVDERRYDVPVLLVCPEFTTAQAKAWRSNLHGFLLQRPASIDMAPR